MPCNDKEYDYYEEEFKKDSNKDNRALGRLLFYTVAAIAVGILIFFAWKKASTIKGELLRTSWVAYKTESYTNDYIEIVERIYFKNDGEYEMEITRNDRNDGQMITKSSGTWDVTEDNELVLCREYYERRSQWQQSNSYKDDDGWYVSKNEKRQKAEEYEYSLKGKTDKKYWYLQDGKLWYSNTEYKTEVADSTRFISRYGACLLWGLLELIFLEKMIKWIGRVR